MTDSARRRVASVFRRDSVIVSFRRKNDDEKTTTTRLFVSRARRERVCRVANAVRVLSALFLAIHPPAIEDVTRCSMEWGTDPKDMLGDAFLRRTLERETERRRAKGGA